MPLDPPAASLPEPGRSSGTALVGREAEREALRRAVAAAQAGHGGVVLLAGEPGAGKTRLLDIAAADARAVGATVLRGGALAAAGMPPYLPFVEALARHGRETPPERLAAQLGPFPGPLAAILPEYAPVLAPAGPLPPGQDRYRLFEAVGDLLAGIARETGRPLLLTLDDLQWADASTLDLLVAVARRTATEPVAVAAAYRAGDAARNPAFGPALAALGRLPATVVLPLAPLTGPEIARLAAGFVGGPVTPESAARLAAECGGNPFFAEALLRHRLGTGRVVPDIGGFAVAGAPGDAVPTTIRAVLRERLGQVGPDTADLLAVAALLGRSFDVALLAEIADRAPDATEAALLPALALDLLRLDGDGRLAFGHDTLREALLAELPPLRRRRWHDAAARALARTHADDPDAHAARIAYHHLRGGDRPAAIAWSLRTAERASRAHAPHEAADHLRAALDLLPEQHPDRGETLLRLGEADLLAADDQAAVAFAAAADWFRQRQPPDPARLARALRRLGDAEARRERHAAARAAYESALDAPGDDPGHAPERVRTLTRLGALLSTSLHDHRAGAALLERAVAAGDTMPAADAAAARRALGNLLVRRGDLAGGIALLEEALRLAEAAADPAEAAECCAALAPARFWQGEVERSAEVSRRRLRHAEQTRDPYELRHVFVWLAICAAIRGRLDEARARLAEAEAQVARLSSPEPRAYLDFVRGALAASTGDEAAVPLLAAAVDQFRAIGPGALVWYLGWLGVAQARRGERAAAAAVLDELERLLAPIPSEEAPGDPVALAAEIALLLGDRARLARLAPRLERLGGRFHDLLVDRLRGEAALRLGRAADAPPLLAAAEAVARREGLVFELAAVLAARADLAVAERRLADAIALREEAADLLAPVAPAAAARHRAAAAEARAKLRAPVPAGLTRRELEVLREVVAGRSNREIADALFLTEKTVEHHVSRILAKTGADNRAAAVAFALRQGLA